MRTTRVWRYFYAAGWMVLYFGKWPVSLGVPLLYTFTVFEANWVLNSIWVICFTALLWDCIVLNESKNNE